MKTRPSAHVPSPYWAFGLSFCLHWILLLAFVLSGSQNPPAIHPSVGKETVGIESASLKERNAVNPTSSLSPNPSLAQSTSPQRARIVDAKQVQARQLEIAQKHAKRERDEINAQLKLAKLNEAITAKQHALSNLDKQKRAADQAYQQLQLAQAAEAKKLKDLAKKNAAIRSNLEEQIAEQAFASKLNNLSAKATSKQVSLEAKHANQVKQAIEAHLIKAPSMRGKRCKIEIKLDKKGKILKTKILSGDPSLAKAALRAIQLTEVIPLSCSSEAEFRRIETTEIQFEG